MATIISSGENVITPTIVLGFESRSVAQTIVHDIIGRPHPDVTLRPASSRSGTITLGFHGPTSETDSATAETLLRTPAVFTAISDERNSLSLSFVVQDDVVRELEDESRDAWVVRCGYREVDVT